jgi:hypothetical protein
MRRDNARRPAELQAETSMLSTEAVSKADRAFDPFIVRADTGLDQGMIFKG